MEYKGEEGREGEYVECALLLEGVEQVRIKEQEQEVEQDVRGINCTMVKRRCRGKCRIRNKVVLFSRRYSEAPCLCTAG